MSIEKLKNVWILKKAGRYSAPPSIRDVKKLFMIFQTLSNIEEKIHTNKSQKKLRRILDCILQLV